MLGWYESFVVDVGGRSPTLEEIEICICVRGANFVRYIYDVLKDDEIYGEVMLY